MPDPSGAKGPLEYIVKRIEEGGPITFADFMDAALYMPEYGYYTSGRPVWGKDGDYITNLDLSPIFAKVVTSQLFEIWRLLGSPKPFTVVEAGPGRGLLSKGILSSAKGFSAELADALEVVLVEKGPHLELSEADGVSVFGGLDELLAMAPITGVVITNELLDALPFHRVVGTEEGLDEIFVGLKGGELKDMQGPLSSSRLKSYLEELGVRLLPGQRAEVAPGVTDWIERVGGLIDRGFVITIDYGLPARELYAPERPGTLLCHYCHTLNDDPYRNVGFQDITAHVDFTSLVRAGEKKGLELTGFCSQQHFLFGAGVLEELIEIKGTGKGELDAIERNQGIKELIMPGGMGDTFKVLIQHKGVASPVLKGFSFKDRSAMLS